MALNSMKEKRSVIYGWILSYMFILLIPLLATGFVYYIAKNIIEDEINSSNKLMIEKRRDDVDNILRDVERFSLEVAAKRQIQQVASLNGVDEDTSYYTIYEAGQELKNYIVFNSTIKRFYIYFNKLKTVIGPGTVNNQETYFDKMLASDGYSVNQWLGKMGRIYQGDYMVMPFYEDGTGSVKGVGFVRSLPVPALGNLSANMVILLDFNHFLENSGAGDTGKRSLLIMDKNNGILAGDIGEGRTGLDYQEMDKDQGNMNKTIGNEKVVVSYTTSRVNGWKYITVTPESVFWEKAQRIRNIMAGGVMACILLGGFLSYFFLRKNYNPLKEIVSYFQGKMNSGKDWKSNEYGILRQAFNETLEVKETIWLKLEQQNRALKLSFIAALLKGRETSVPVHELMANYNITFRYNYFTAMIIYIENMDEEFWNDNKGEGSQKYDLSRFVIMNVVEELINRDYCGYMTEVDDMLACLINVDAAGRNYKEEFLGVISTAKAFIEQNYGISLNFAVGALHESLEAVPHGFKEAVNAMEYTKVMGINHTVFYDEIVMESKNHYYYPAEKEYQLIDCMKSADFTAAAAVLEDIFLKNLVNDNSSMEITRCLVLDLVGTILKTANGIEKAKEEGLIEKMNPASELMRCKTLSDMKNKIFEMVKKTCEYVASNNEQEDGSIKNMVVEIIKNNYKDPNLGIASLADKIGKYPYYVSKIFKEQTGEGILEYINRVRIIKAKELLKENALNQEEIAERVGYTNVRTFQRAFKKLEGTSPGKLKES